MIKEPESKPHLRIADHTFIGRGRIEFLSCILTMESGFHIDWSRTLSAGGVIELLSTSHVAEEQRGRAEERFPHGLSRFGVRCFNGEADLAAELYLETIRRKDFQHLPSRFQSFFACADKGSALRLMEQRKLEGLLWEVEFHTAFAADMRILDCSLRHGQYWQAYTPNPQIEYVIQLPARVVRTATSATDVP